MLSHTPIIFFQNASRYEANPRRASTRIQDGGSKMADPRWRIQHPGSRGGLFLGKFRPYIHSYSFPKKAHLDYPNSSGLTARCSSGLTARCSSGLTARGLYSSGCRCGRVRIELTAKVHYEKTYL
uniref:ORF51 n=1 Tax=Malaco herpesvirus 1 TaxID=3031797 RepID=A0AA48SFH3_9VIRU|nr:TPA_asm: ORF51 [Malaco herpesvirus 1]